MKKLIVSALCLLSFSSLSAIYQWTDKNGVIHYSDDASGSKNAKQKVIKPEATILAKPTALTPKEKLEHQNTVAQVKPNIKISSPADQQTVRNNIGSLQVSASLSAPLAPDQMIRLLIDNIPIVSQKQPIFSLTGVLVGEHTIQVQVIDKSGKVLASSQSITVYMHRFRAK